MTLESYADILKFAIQMQIDYKMEEMQEPNVNEDYLDGIVRGLQIALDKIEASRFLTEDR